MSVNQLIKEITNYCARKFPNVKKIEAKEITLVANNQYSIQGVVTKIVLNNNVEFDYIGGTFISDYDSYFKKV